MTVGDAVVRVSRRTGHLSGWNVAGRELITRPMRLHLTTPLVDNHQQEYDDLWEPRHFGALQEHLRDLTVDRTEGGVVIEAATQVAPPVFDFGMRVTYRYVVTASGTVTVTVSGTPYGDYRDIVQVIGVELGVDPGLRRADWYGRGPGESYPDSTAATAIGRWQADVDEMFFPYVMPQDTGKHLDTRWFALTDRQGRGLFVQGDEPLAFSAWPHSGEAITSARHRTDLVVDPDAVTVNIDHAVLGLGSNSWGSEVLDSYRIRFEDFRYTFTFAPVASGDVDPADLDRYRLHADREGA